MPRKTPEQSTRFPASENGKKAQSEAKVIGMTSTREGIVYTIEGPDGRIHKIVVAPEDE